MIPTTKSASPGVPSWKTISAFAILYLVWGSTFLAIRIGVLAVPPLLFAGTRFFTAGLLVLGFALSRKLVMPTGRQWLSVATLSTLIFLCNYGLLFWAERRVPSGVASIMLATIPTFMALSEILLLGTQKLTLRLTAALVVGLTGVAILTLPSLRLGGAPIDHLGAIALLASAVFWSVASALSRKLPLPPSKAVSSGAQMLLGGALLLVASIAIGDPHRFNPAAVTPLVWGAMLYLIFFGSILAFTVYVWLIDHQPPTRVGTYAYVNPVVAVLIGYFFAHEPLGPRTILGAVGVLTGVVLITTTRTRGPAPNALPAEEA